MPHSSHHAETIRHRNSSYVTTKLYGTSTCGSNINTIFSKKSYFNVSYRRCMPHTLAWRQAGLAHACQSGNMAMLLTSYLFVFEISFLPNYRGNYYDYIIKWCCHWCVSLDIAHMLALRIASVTDRNATSSSYATRHLVLVTGFCAL